MINPNRRKFLKTGVAAMAGSSIAGAHTSAKPAESKGGIIRQNPLPRWRGFNLMAFFSSFHSDPEHKNRSVSLQDLKWIRDWGFDYIRLPFSYWLLVDGNWKQTGTMSADEVCKLDERSLASLDRAVESCIEHGLHITLNMHRAPGYCINGWDKEPFNLFKDQAAEEAFTFYWDMLARRYKGISASNLSFNLVNEAPGIGDKMSREDYRRVMLRARDAIRSVSPERTSIIDGTGVGNDVVYNMMHEDVAQAFHAYDPHLITHYKASWIPGSKDWPVPEYPCRKKDGTIIDKRYLAVKMAPWAELTRRGVGVHCGEFGCYSHTPHQVFLNWFADILDLLKANDIGYALWNFRGGFGILDSNRPDVDYEDWYGHKLDRKMLDLMLE